MVKPTKEELLKLLESIKTHPEMEKITPDIGSLLGMKMVEPLMKDTEGTPKWDLEGLRVFCKENGLRSEDSIADAIAKLR